MAVPFAIGLADKVKKRHDLHKRACRGRELIVLRRKIGADLLASPLGERYIRKYKCACAVCALVALTITTLDLLNVRLVEAVTKFIRVRDQRATYPSDQLSAIAAPVEAAKSVLKPALKVTPVSVTGPKITVAGRRRCNHQHRHWSRARDHGC